jgi:hypothetical protein
MTQWKSGERKSQGINTRLSAISTLNLEPKLPNLGVCRFTQRCRLRYINFTRTMQLTYVLFLLASSLNAIHASPLKRDGGTTCSGDIQQGDGCNENAAVASCCVDFHNIAICQGTWSFEPCGADNSLSPGGSNCVGGDGGNAYCG